MKIVIGVVIGSDGSYAANQQDKDGSIDWAFIEDCCCAYVDGESVYPETTRRYLVMAEVEVPNIATEVAGDISPTD